MITTFGITTVVTFTIWAYKFSVPPHQQDKQGFIYQQLYICRVQHPLKLIIENLTTFVHLQYTATNHVPRHTVYS